MDVFKIDPMEAYRTAFGTACLLLAVAIVLLILGLARLARKGKGKDDAGAVADGGSMGDGARAGAGSILRPAELDFPREEARRGAGPGAGRTAEADTQGNKGGAGYGRQGGYNAGRSGNHHK